MAARIAQVTLDVHDTAVEAEFWSAALGMRIEAGEDDRSGSVRRTRRSRGHEFCVLRNEPRG